MEFDLQDQEIIKLLTKLKDARAEYPQGLLAARRQTYLKRMAEIGLGIGANTGIENAAKNGKVPSPSPATSTLLETALVVAIIAEAGTAAYFYRDKLADFFQTITTSTRVQEVTTPPIFTTLEVQGVTLSPVVTPTFLSPTISESPTGIAITPTTTPNPGVIDDNIEGTTPANFAPVPNGNNGNHYGQTPKPERTREPNDNNDQPPRDRPTKTR